MILNDLAEYLRRKRQGDPNFHVVSDGGYLIPTDMGPEVQEDCSGYVRSRVIEGNEGFFTKAVPMPDRPASGFTHFLDGIQRSQLVGYEGIVPLLYGFTGAVIRERGPNRCLGVWEEAVLKEAIYAPFDEIDVEGLLECGVPAVDTTFWLNVEGEPTSNHYRTAAMNAVKRDRSEAEASLSRRWVAACGEREECWLFVDGCLTLPMQHPNIAGIVKSHQTQYFPAKDHCQILRMGVGERSAMFFPEFGQEGRRKVFSWYLRLHSCRGRDLTYGLIRIEVNSNPSMVSRADEISAWLMAERQPLASPDPRWDKLLYPIRDCEEYLRSIAPSHAVMEGMLGA
jgi:hypothetical protein